MNTGIFWSNDRAMKQNAVKLTQFVSPVAYHFNRSQTMLCHSCPVFIVMTKYDTIDDLSIFIHRTV